MTKKVLITCALPYANGPLHFGHIAGVYLPGDCYARFKRLCADEVLFLCGSDEYGIAITLSAELAGRSPKEHVDLYNEVNRNFFKQLNMSFDHYSRTTWEGHVETVQQFFNDLVANGYIEARVTDQLYSKDDGKFLADRYVTGTCPKCGFDRARGDECPKCGASYEAVDLKNPRSKLTGSTLERKPTKHWFLLLDAFKEKLSEWLASKHWKPNVVNFTKNYIGDLRPRAITRDSNWGIPVPLPDTEGKVLYVWFDAPIGYISAAKEWALETGDAESWKKYWLDPNTKLVQFIGKDNIPFHAVIFPAMCMGQNIPYKLVDELPANEFYNLEGRQFSKSEGWTIDLEAFFKRYTADQIRYAIAANAPEHSDSEFTWKDFLARCNGDLVGKFGNFANRTLVFLQRQCGGCIPEAGELEPSDKEYLEKIDALVEEAYQCYDQFKLRRASQVVMELAQAGNIYFDAKKPWVAAKDPSLHESMRTTLALCLQGLRALCVISCPILPESADRLYALLGLENSLSQETWKSALEAALPSGKALPQPQILFAKIDEKLIEEEIEKLSL